jgi:hypothetical protein
MVFREKGARGPERENAPPEAERKMLLEVYEPCGRTAAQANLPDFPQSFVLKPYGNPVPEITAADQSVE